MRYSIIENKELKEITIPKCDFIYATSILYQKITECLSGDIVCTNNLNNFNVVDSLGKSLVYGDGRNDSDLSDVTTVSISESVTNGRLSLKGFILDVLSSVRVTAYTKTNISKVTNVNLINALIKTFISRNIKFLIIKDMYGYASNENISRELLNILKAVAISTGVIVICDHNVFKSTKNTNLQESNYALGK